MISSSTIASCWGYKFPSISERDSSFEAGVSCSNTQGWIRFAFSDLNPELVKLVNISDYKNQWVSVPFRGKRLTHKPGFMVALDANQVYTMVLNQADHPTNISYKGAYYNFKPGQYIIMQHILRKRPDRVEFSNSIMTGSESLIPLTSISLPGSWYWDNDTLTLR